MCALFGLGSLKTKWWSICSTAGSDASHNLTLSLWSYTFDSFPSFETLDTWVISMFISCSPIECCLLGSIWSSFEDILDINQTMENWGKIYTIIKRSSKSILLILLSFVVFTFLCVFLFKTSEHDDANFQGVSWVSCTMFVGTWIYLHFDDDDDAWTHLSSHTN